MFRVANRGFGDYDNEMGKGWKSLANWSFGEFLSWLFRQAWLLVLGSGLVTAVLAFLQELPWLYIFLAALTAIGITSWALAQFSVRRSFSSPKFKLVVETVTPGHWPDGDQQKIKPLLVLKNVGNFPIEVDCKDVDWAMNGEGGIERKDVQTTAIIPPFGQQFLHGAIFSRPLAMAGNEKAVQIVVKANIKYGRPGTLKYEHIQDYTLNCFIDPENRANDTIWIQQSGRGKFA